jgi:6-phosphogluconolactonase
VALLPELRLVADAAALHRAAAEEFVQQANEAVAANGRFTVALAGGSTPKGAYALLARNPKLRDTVPWQATHVFWGDERTVPPDHRDSNFRMAQETLLSQVPVPPANVHRIQGEDSDPARAALEYEAVLRSFVAPDAEGSPRFDLILLGLGSDGHTASLFPQTSALEETDRLVVANYVEVLGTTRITLTVPVINRARYVVLLASGPEKASAVWATLAGPSEPARRPAQLISPSDGRQKWILDAGAATMLRNEAPPSA